MTDVDVPQATTENAQNQPLLIDDDLANVLMLPLVPTPRISDLLSLAKERGSDVNKTAAKKSDLVNVNLRRAVAQAKISMEEIYELLQDAEEHDAQYHYFFRVDDAAVATGLADMDKVGTALLGVGWRSTFKFPRPRAKPVGEEWGDFRREVGVNDAQGWVLKLYWGNFRWVLDKAASITTAAKKTRIWLPVPMREVWLIRWRADDGLLELSLPRLGSRQDQLDAKQAILTHVAKIVDLEHLEEFHFERAATTIIKQYEEFSEELHLGGSATLMSPDGGSTIMTTRNSQQGLLDSADRAAAIKHYRNCRELCMTWLPTSATENIKEDLKVLTGHWGAQNSILFTTKSTGKAVRYVTRRLIGLERRGQSAATNAAEDQGMDQGTSAN